MTLALVVLSHTIVVTVAIGTKTMQQSFDTSQPVPNMEEEIKSNQHNGGSTNINAGKFVPEQSTYSITRTLVPGACLIKP